VAYSYWTNVGVAVQSAIGAAKTITAITKVSPGVAEFAADPGLADGDYAVFKSIVGMYQLENRIARITSGSGSGPYFRTLEGVDCSLYTAATGGSAYELTFGTSLALVTGVTVSGGEPEFADITRIHDSQKIEVPTRTSPFRISFECLWDPTDSGLAALKTASDALAERGVLITFSSGYKAVFMGYISSTLLPTGSAGEAVKTTVEIRASGRPTFYTT